MTRFTAPWLTFLQTHEGFIGFGGPKWLYGHRTDSGARKIDLVDTENHTAQMKSVNTTRTDCIAQYNYTNAKQAYESLQS